MGVYPYAAYDFVRSPFFFFTVTLTPEFYTLSLHDALPICILVFSKGGHGRSETGDGSAVGARYRRHPDQGGVRYLADRKSTRLNSSHVAISYAVFCLKKKKPRATDSSPVATSTWTRASPSS